MQTLISSSRMPWMVPAALTLILSSIPATAAASWDVGGQALHARERIYPGVLVRWRAARPWGAQLEAGYRSEPAFGHEIVVAPLQLSVLGTPYETARVGVYLLAGLGWYPSHATGRHLVGANQQRLGAHAGGGIVVPLASWLVVDLSVRHAWIKPMVYQDDTRRRVERRYDDSGAIVSAGVSVRL